MEFSILLCFGLVLSTQVSGKFFAVFTIYIFVTICYWERTTMEYGLFNSHSSYRLLLEKSIKSESDIT